MLNPFIKVISASCKYGQKKNGVEEGAKLLSKFLPNKKDVIHIDSFENDGYKNLFNTHYDLLDNGYKPITIGGDHSISLSTVASSIKKFQEDLTVVWVDAHADINTRNSSTTNNLHGMPLAFLLGHDNIYDFPTMKPEQLIYIGLRDVDYYEKQVINELDIESYPMEYVRENSLSDILDNIYKRSEVIHLSFDVDSIDPTIISSTGTPVSDGLSLDNAHTIIKKLSPKIKSSDIVEFNPYLTDDNNALYKQTCDIANLIYLLE